MTGAPPMSEIAEARILVTPPPGVWEQRLWHQTRQPRRVLLQLVSCSHHHELLENSIRDNMASNSVHVAALNKQFGLVRSLVSQDPKLVNAVDEDGRTPLHWAASSGSVDIARYLIDQGADVNRGDPSGWAPLHIAEGSPKARLNTADRVGNTPLHLAMESAHAEAACLLIEAGADRERTNVDGEMPEDMEGVGGQEQRRARAYVVERCGKR
ncbi:ankyrin repeat-containing domain protein [Trametes gibbosa]|nr:ankyrin repeat-containing domain protein [Trametes gibbosa]